MKQTTWMEVKYRMEFKQKPNTYTHPFIYGQERSIKKPRKSYGNGTREREKDTEKRTD